MTKADRQRLSKDETEWGVWYAHTSKRSKHAQDVDNGESADLTINPYLWMSDPSRHDYPLVDTIVRKKPKGYTKARGKSAYEEIMEMFKF